MPHSYSWQHLLLASSLRCQREQKASSSSLRGVQALVLKWCMEIETRRNHYRGEEKLIAPVTTLPLKLDTLTSLHNNNIWVSNIVQELKRLAHQSTATRDVRTRGELLDCTRYPSSTSCSSLVSGSVRTNIFSSGPLIFSTRGGAAVEER